MKKNIICVVSNYSKVEHIRHMIRAIFKEHELELTAESRDFIEYNGKRIVFKVAEACRFSTVGFSEIVYMRRED